MSHVITIDLPPGVAERAQAVAERTQKSMEAVLLEWLNRAATDLPIEWLPDAEILALANLQMSDADQTELNDLLVEQREGTINAPQHERLHHLLEQYREGMVRKAKALQIAVERGLQPPLSN